MMVVTFKAIGKLYLASWDCVVVCVCVIENIKDMVKSEFSDLSEEYSDMESFPDLVTELNNAIGNYSSSVRNIKAGMCLKL